MLGRRDPALDLNPFERVTRDGWTKVMAAIMASLSLPALHAIAAGGEDEFIRVSAPILAAHELTRSDLRRIYAVIKRTSDANGNIGRKRTRIVLENA